MPNKFSCAYNIADICPGSRKNLSLQDQDRSEGSNLKNSLYKICIKSAPPIAPPGWPEAAFSTMAAARILILSAERVEIESEEFKGKVLVLIN